MAALITSIPASIATFQEMVETLGKRVTSMETTAGENFEALSIAEKSITELKVLNTTLADRIDDLENWSRRVHMHIINVPEDSETCGDLDMVTFVSTQDVTGN